jgi:hypothetical protein
MRIGRRNWAALAMMAEQGADPGGSHGAPALAAFQGNEQERGVGERPFQPPIFVEDFENFWRQGQDALLASFAENSRIGQLQIRELKCQDLAGAQPIEQHQTDHSKIAEGAKAVPEIGDFASRERHNDAPGLP